MAFRPGLLFLRLGASIALLLALSALVPSSGRILEDVGSVKIHLPGLCRGDKGCLTPPHCLFCCPFNSQCYFSEEECTTECPKYSPLDPVVASSTRALPPPV
nr:uncharacterized protein LOC127341658 [Lolium perenne]